MHATVVWPTQFKNRNSTNHIALADAWKGVADRLISGWCLAVLMRRSASADWVLSGGPQRLVGGDILIRCRNIRGVMPIKRVPPGFIIPAQPVMAARPPSGSDWVHEIKHDGYRMIVRRDGPSVRLYSRNACDWTVRLAAIAAAAERIKAKSFTIERRGGCAGT